MTTVLPTDPETHSRACKLLGKVDTGEDKPTLTGLIRTLVNAEWEKVQAGQGA